MANKGKLHEVIAVEKDVRGTATKIIGETNKTFSSKHQLFATHSKIYTPLKDDDQERPSEDEKPQPITTINDKLDYFQKQLMRLFDVILQKEEANTRAKEDIIVYHKDEKIVLAEQVPVSALVQLENIFESIRAQVYDVIPTLDPTKKWDADVAAGKNYYRTGETTRQSSKKIPKPITLHPGTDKHPPQVQLVTEDVPNGTWTIAYFSGMLSPAEKSELLSRVDLVLEGIKKARARANMVEVEPLAIGKKIFKFINEGKI